MKTGAMLLLVMCMVLCGCDMVSDMMKGDAVPENLPPLPEECIGPSNLYEQALRAAYTNLEGSQMQANSLANKLSQCMTDAGLTEGEAKGIVKEIEKSIKNEVEGK